MIVIVLGMHRSGTSMLSSIVHTLGIKMGNKDDLARHNPDSQPYGYWEDQGFVALNRAMIYTAGGDWHKPPGRLRILSASMEYRDRIQELIDERVMENDNWGWKDPRNSLTIEAYQFMLQRMEDVKYLHIFRNGQSVAHSLIKRGEVMHSATDQVKAFEGLAYEHERRIRDFLNRYQVERYVISYEDILKYPEYEIGRLAQFLGIDNVDKLRLAVERVKIK